MFAGIAVQVLVLVARMAAGGAFPGAQFFATLAQGVSWSVLVCGAVAIGTVAARARSAITGLIGLIAGPISWGLAKGVQKGVRSHQPPESNRRRMKVGGNVFLLPNCFQIFSRRAATFSPIAQLIE